MRRLPLLLCVLALGCGDPAGKKHYTREEFKKAVLGASLDEVRALLGAPDEILSGPARHYWQYDGRVIDPRTKKPQSVLLEVGGGRVRFIDWMDPPPVRAGPPPVTEPDRRPAPPPEAPEPRLRGMMGVERGPAPPPERPAPNMPKPRVYRPKD